MALISARAACFDKAGVAIAQTFAIIPGEHLWTWANQWAALHPRAAYIEAGETHNPMPALTRRDGLATPEEVLSRVTAS